ncbi:glycerophosphodiester phosphodiesterase [Foetidibacter luteolus]|uniref:glycerophosphodiester phosphodiesterase n=1 Tax=Foetidibacter luteolus TaxID=2608880 RepID=UPI00129AD73D|nr:glycerophosphodiester phosphodiesterase family protein [Foetidibacter luteolus]
MKNTVFIPLFLIAIMKNVMAQQQVHQFARNKVVAHRGAWKLNNLPENSIASLQEAVKLGCTGSEFDVHITSDDSLVVNHDAEYAGMPIGISTYSQLAAVKLPNGETISTLQQYLAAGLKQGITKLVLEIKPSKVSGERALLSAEKSVALVKAMNADAWMIYISFDYEVLKKIHQLHPQAETQYLNGDKAPELLKADGISGADYHYSVFQKHPEWIDEAKKLGLVLNAWTVNDAPTMAWLLDKNFDAITTNEPELLLQLVKKHVK